MPSASAEASTATLSAAQPRRSSRNVHATTHAPGDFRRNSASGHTPSSRSATAARVTTGSPSGSRTAAPGSERAVATITGSSPPALRARMYRRVASSSHRVPTTWWTPGVARSGA